MINSIRYTLCEIKDGEPQRPNRQFLHRLDRANRFRTDRYRLRLSHVSCAKLLGVSVRTVQNWEAARARLPYAAYKLLRLLASGKHLDSAHWDGFYVQGDALVTPEGHRFQAGDLAWWSLAIRQAEAFRVLSRKQREMRDAAERDPGGNGGNDGGARDALAPVATSLMRQVRSGPSSLPDRKIRSEVAVARHRDSQARADRCKQRVSVIASPSTPSNLGGEGGDHSLTPQYRPKSASLAAKRGSK